jgi:hypothetical protein
MPDRGTVQVHMTTGFSTFRQRRHLRALARELDQACPGLGARLCPARAWSMRALALSVAALAPCGTAAVLRLAPAGARVAVSQPAG